MKLSLILHFFKSGNLSLVAAASPGTEEKSNASNAVDEANIGAEGVGSLAC